MRLRKICQQCGKEFVAHRYDMRFCSPTCKYEFVVTERQLALEFWRQHQQTVSRADADAA